MQRPPTGARALSCLCAAFRAFRFARRCSGWLSRRMRLLGRACLGGRRPPVQKKRALFLTNRDRLGRSTGLSAALRPPGYGAVLFPRFAALVRWVSEPGIQHRTGRHCQEAAQVSEAVKSGASAGAAAAGISAEAIRQLAPPRQRKLQIACFRLAAKTRSLRCASSPHKISDFAGAPNAQLSAWQPP